MYARADNLVQVVRRYVGGHAYGNAGTAVEQHKGYPRRQLLRLGDAAIEVGHMVHGALLDLR